MLAVRVVTSAIYFRVAALFAKLLKRLPARAHVIFQLCDAGAARVPLLFELALADFQAKLFAAETFELLCELFALFGESGSLIPDRGFLLQKRGFPAVKFRALLLQTRREGFGCGETLMKGGKFGASSGMLVLLGMNGGAQLRELLDQMRAFSFRIRAGNGCSGMLIFCSFGAHPGVLGIFAEAQ
jgi:hypothetical protein